LDIKLSLFLDIHNRLFFFWKWKKTQFSVSIWRQLAGAGRVIVQEIGGAVHGGVGVGKLIQAPVFCGTVFAITTSNKGGNKNAGDN